MFPVQIVSVNTVRQIPIVLAMKFVVMEYANTRMMIAMMLMMPPPSLPVQ